MSGHGPQQIAHAEGGGAMTARVAVAPGYETLAEVLDAALEQAQAGKGKERHACAGEAFGDQQIVQLGRWLGSGSTDGQIFQAVKKLIESTRLPRERAQAEILGAINYASAAYILRGEGVAEPDGGG